MYIYLRPEINLTSYLVVFFHSSSWNLRRPEIRPADFCSYVTKKTQQDMKWGLFQVWGIYTHVKIRTIKIYEFKLQLLKILCSMHPPMRVAIFVFFGVFIKNAYNYLKGHNIKILRPLYFLKLLISQQNQFFKPKNSFFYPPKNDFWVFQKFKKGPKISFLVLGVKWFFWVFYSFYLVQLPQLSI